MRYRNQCKSTRHSIQDFHHVAKLGTIQCVEGRRYRHSRNGITYEVVLVKGSNGSARFHGLLWGYGGEGPRGLVRLLRLLGIKQAYAEQIAFTSPRKNCLGTDWIVTLNNGVACWQYDHVVKSFATEKEVPLDFLR